MFTRYFRKKNPSNGAGAVEWVEMSGREYYRFVTDPSNKNRYFLDMGDVVLECTEAEYKRYKAEDDHRNYIQEQNEDMIIMSLNTMEQQEILDGTDVIADMEQNVEESALYNLLKNDLRKALQCLPKYDYWLIYELYLSVPPKTVRQLSKESGTPVMTLQNRKLRIIKALKKILQI